MFKCQVRDGFVKKLHLHWRVENAELLQQNTLLEKNFFRFSALLVSKDQDLRIINLKVVLQNDNTILETHLFMLSSI